MAPSGHLCLWGNSNCPKDDLVLIKLRQPNIQLYDKHCTVLYVAFKTCWCQCVWFCTFRFRWFRLKGPADNLAWGLPSATCDDKLEEKRGNPGDVRMYVSYSTDQDQEEREADCVPWLPVSALYLFLERSVVLHHTVLLIWHVSNSWTIAASQVHRQHLWVALWCWAERL